ncbi:hypothetical protein BS78_01G158000 [Paspalum vaginatum]|nr:hypothetical protein BS78_01G158000 [Paspalum vaginatum]
MAGRYILCICLLLEHVPALVPSARLFMQRASVVVCCCFWVLTIGCACKNVDRQKLYSASELQRGVCMPVLVSACVPLCSAFCLYFLPMWMVSFVSCCFVIFL